MRPLMILVLLAVAMPAFSQAPAPVVALSTSLPAAGSLSPAVPPIDQNNPVLDRLVHKRQIVRITKTDGRKFLGRVVSGDHGVYIVQMFHFAGPPRLGTRMAGSGRRRHLIRTSRQTTIADASAVKMLLAGVAGTLVDPRVIYGQREILGGQDVREIQAPSPPKLPKGTPTMPPKSPPASPITAAAARPVWTLTTLWSDRSRRSQQKHKKGTDAVLY